MRVRHVVLDVVHRAHVLVLRRLRPISASSVRGKRLEGKRRLRLGRARAQYVRKGAYVATGALQAVFAVAAARLLNVPVLAPVAVAVPVEVADDVAQHARHVEFPLPLARN